MLQRERLPCQRSAGAGQRVLKTGREVRTDVRRDAAQDVNLAGV